MTETFDPRERIIVAIDTSSLDEAKNLVSKLKEFIKIFKVGSELFTTCGPKAVEAVREAGAEVFLDLKFHDIPNTVAQSVRAAVRLGVSMLTIHAQGGLQMMQEACVASADEASKRGVPPPKLIAVTLLTSLSPDEVTREVGLKGALSRHALRYARLAQKAGLDGIVASAKEASRIKRTLGEAFLLLTPGIRPPGFEKGDQERVVTPRQAFEAGSDYVVIGRPITQADDPVQAVNQIFQAV